MKAIKKILAVILSIITVMSFGISVSAEENWESLLGTVVDGSVLTNKKESSANALKSLRGYYLSDGTAYISDQGNNVVYYSGSTNCNRTAEEVRVNVYLQKLVNGSWQTVAYQSHSEYNTNYAHNGYFAVVSPGYFYRTVCSHVTINGSTVESISSATEGLYI